MLKRFYVFLLVMFCACTIVGSVNAYDDNGTIPGWDNNTVITYETPVDFVFTAGHNYKLNMSEMVLIQHIIIERLGGYHLPNCDSECNWMLNHLVYGEYDSYSIVSAFRPLDKLEDNWNTTYVGMDGITTYITIYKSSVVII
jgi:hypothetical protein